MGPQAAFIRPLLEAMGKQRALRVLLLPHNDLSDTQSIKDLGRRIAENTKLERLDLNSCQIAGPGSEELIQGLWNQRSLQQLSLAGSAWTEKSFDRLISLLPRLKLLHALDLGNCTFSSSQVKKLLDSLDALGRRTLSVNLHGSLIGLEEQLLVEAFNGRMLKEGRPLHVDSTRIWP
jgi:Ran GTPase-activating protein (RanGAP) involved in mRNA processing and transport